jgi:hypothetical protein
MQKKIEKAIKETLVISNPSSIPWAVNRIMDLFTAKRTVFAIRRTMDGVILGCFDSREKAEKYINGNTTVAIQELSVA